MYATGEWCRERMEIYQEPQPQIQYSQQLQSQSMPALQPALQGPVQFANQDQSFLRWLFSFREESVVPLRNAWRGREFNYSTQTWEEPINHPPHVIMNEKGITWAISLIESYFSPVFLTTDLTFKTYNFRMREVTRVIWNSLCLRFAEFELAKSDIPRVAEEIESKISAILLGAINDGYRTFFSTQNQYVETKNLTQPMQGEKASIFSGISKIFRKEPNQQYGGGY
jgi:hypothetical protein